MLNVYVFHACSRLVLITNAYYRQVLEGDRPELRRRSLNRHWITLGILGKDKMCALPQAIYGPIIELSQGLVKCGERVAFSTRGIESDIPILHLTQLNGCPTSARFFCCRSETNHSVHIYIARSPFVSPVHNVVVLNMFASPSFV